MKQRITQLMMVTFVFALAVGCTKPRKKVVQQGAEVTNKNSIDNYHRASKVVSPDDLNTADVFADLKVKSDFEGVITLTTGRAIRSVARSSAENFKNETTFDSFQDFPVVEYTVNYPAGMPNIVGDNLRFRGRPGGYVYQIVTHFEHDKLWVSKIAKKEDVPADELTFGTEIQPGVFKIPLVTYPVSFLDKRLLKNADNEDTNVYYFEPVESADSASHLNVHILDGTRAEPILKVYTFKPTYFNGEWFFAKTIVQAKSSSSLKLDQGFSSVAVDSSLSAARRVKFVRTQSSLQVLNTNVDERLLEAALDKQEGRKNELDVDMEFEQVMSIPAEFIDYRMETNNQGVREPKEEEHEENNFRNRAWVKVDFKSAVTIQDSRTSMLRNFFSGSRMLSDLRVADDYFSFTQTQKDTGAKVRYSFYRVESALSKNYEPRRAIIDDLEHFGIFRVQKAFIRNYEQNVDQDIEQHMYIQRFNPKKPLIEFHMSHQMFQSDFSKEMALDALEYWNKAFELAGTHIKLKLNTEESVDLGDIRYNVLHIVDQISSGIGGGGLLFGVGPSISDPQTGEVVSVSNTLHIDSFRYIAVGVVKDYLMMKSNLTAKARRAIFQGFRIPIGGESVSGPGDLQNILRNGSMSLKVIDPATGESKPKVFSRYKPGTLGTVEKFVPEEVPGLFPERLVMELEGVSGRTLKTEEQITQAYREYGRQLSANGLYQVSDSDSFLNSNSRNHFDKIEALCPEVMDFADTLVDKFKPGSVSNPVIIGCANKLIRGLAIRTLVHELGHNFGLMHNFEASSDKPNFWTEEEVKEHFHVDVEAEKLTPDFLKSTSVMDYLPKSRDGLHVPGKYDIAALRYAYTGTMKNLNGGVLKIKDTTLPLEDPVNFGHQLKDMRVYKYCSDFEVHPLFNFNALCRQHDLGTTPGEVAEFYISEYYDSLAMSTYRFDRLTIGFIDRAMKRFDWNVVPLKRLYDEWRFRLMDFVGNENKYLNSMDVEEFDAELLKMEKSLSHSKDFADWNPVREKVLTFIEDIIFLPNYYCVGFNSRGEVRAVEIEDAIQDIKRLGTADEVIDCNDQAVIDVLQSEHDVEYVMDVGYPLLPRRYSLLPDDEDNSDEVDVSGVVLDRQNAADMMSERYEFSMAHMQKDFYPNPMDEPRFRQKILSRTMERMQSGLNIGPVLQAKMGDGNTLPESEGMMKMRETLANTQGNIFLQKYKHEQGLLENLYVNVANGHSVPGEPFQTRARMAPFMSQVSNDPQYIQQRHVTATRLPGRGFITAEPQNFVSVAFIQMFQGISAQVDPTIQMISEQDIADAKLIADQLKVLLPEGMQVLKGANIMNLVNGTRDGKIPGINAFLESPKITDGAKAFVRTAFQVEVMIFSSQVGQAFRVLASPQFAQASPEEQAEVQQAINQFAEMTITSEMYDQFGVPGPLGQMNLKDRLDRVELNILGMQADKLELEAKRDMILNTF